MDALTPFQAPGIEGAFTWSGKDRSLGSLVAGEVEICAMGPQVGSLGSAQGFGVHLPPHLIGKDKWTRSIGCKESWLRGHVSEENGGCRLQLRFLGNALSFVFYIKADICTVEGQTLKPASLRRFSGEASSLLFSKKNTCLKLDAHERRRVEVVPLSCQEELWGADFLIAFEIPPFEAEAIFLLSRHTV